MKGNSVSQLQMTGLVTAKEHLNSTMPYCFNSATKLFSVT